MSLASTSPLITVIVPVYNVETYVGTCIASLRAQTLSDFEAIIVDDGATDASHDRAMAAIDGDPRFVVIRQANAGLSAARNTGLEHAKGRFVAFVDSDDAVTPDYLSALHDALTDSDAPWAACAIRSVYPDGQTQVHSAIHSAPDPGDASDPQLWPMKSWADVINHFPSAWNKLYRASLIKGLRFDPGTLYEDHAFFHQAAARADAIVHVPRPLYLQTRERPGQITAEDSPRVFDQISVLEKLATLMDRSKPGAVAAFGTLASRLLYERACVIRDPDRRRAFLAAGQALLDRHSLRYMPDWTTGIGPSLGLELAGHIPLSVVIPWDGGGAGGLTQTLEALAQMMPCGAEVIVACDGPDPQTALDLAAGAAHPPGIRAVASDGTGPGAARNCGLDAARGAYVIFLDAGDTITHWAALHQVGAMLHFGADIGLVPFQMGTQADALVHPGFHNTAGLPAAPDTPQLLALTPDMVLGLYCHPSSKIFDRAFLVRRGLRFGTGALSDWHLGIRASLCAKRILRLCAVGVAISLEPDHRRLWQGHVPVADLTQAITQIGASLPDSGCADLPPGWRHRLVGRALWEKLGFVPMSRWQRLRYWLAATAAISALEPLPPDAVIDPYLGRRLTRLLSAAGQSRLHCIMRLLGR